MAIIFVCSALIGTFTFGALIALPTFLNPDRRSVSRLVCRIGGSRRDQAAARDLQSTDQAQAQLPNGVAHIGPPDNEVHSF
jgi:hypothetical protein